MRFRHTHSRESKLNHHKQFIFFTLGLFGIIVLSLVTFYHFTFAATATLLPNAYVSNVNFPGTADAYTRVDEGATPDGFIISNQRGTHSGDDGDYAELAMHDQASVATATQVVLHVYMNNVDTSGRGFDQMRIEIRDGSTVLATTDFTPTNSNSAWRTVTYNGNLSQTQTDNLRARITRVTACCSGPATDQLDNVFIDSVYMSMTYTSSIQIEQASYRWFENNNDASPMPSYAVGDTGPAGGLVFFVDTGNIYSEFDYLEAAPTDQSTGAKWGCDGATAGANDTVIGTGEQNTADIVAQGCTTDDASTPAAEIADNYSVNGYSDWFLPSRDELNLMYTNLYQAGLGGFATSTYWSSSEYSIYVAWYQTFDVGGGQLYGSKSGNNHVRSIRAFSSTDITGPTVSSPLATQDTPAIAPAAGTPFRLRLNLGVTNGDLSAGDFKLRYAAKSGASCSTNPASYSDITSFSTIKFYDNSSAPDGASYSSSLDDPTRSGITAVGQSYEEANPYSVTTTIPAGQDGLWDFALTMDASAAPGNYCILTTTISNTSLNSYSQVPEIIVPPPTLEQSSYRFYENDDSVGAPATYSIGDTGPAGGLIFYVDGSTYYEAAPSGWNGASDPIADWGCHGTAIVGADGTAIGTGEQNTTDMEADCTAIGVAADLAANLLLNGYDDWFLPSVDELSAIDTSLVSQGLGDFSTSSLYWSSSESSASPDFYAWQYSFGSGGCQGCNFKSASLAVRPIRAFTSTSPANTGSPIAADNTAATVEPGTPFRLRQLIKQTTGTTMAGTGFKLQIGEKVTSCSAANYGDMTNLVSTSTGFQQTASVFNQESHDSQLDIVWENISSAAADDSSDALARVQSGSAPGFVNRIMATGYGFNIPADATIKGIEAQTESSQYGVGFNEYEVFLMQSGSADGDNMASGVTFSGVKTYGSATDLWGLGWTPADINNSGFGLLISLDHSEAYDSGALSLDYMAINVHYSIGGDANYFHDNTNIIDDAIITNTTAPTVGSGSIIAQVYNEDLNFTANNAVSTGDHALWDFSLTGDASMDGKTYCYRVVHADGTPLASYAHYPEVTFGSGQPEPTLEQVTRGGQAVVNGVKMPFSW